MIEFDGFFKLPIICKCASAAVDPNLSTMEYTVKNFQLLHERFNLRCTNSHSLIEVAILLVSGLLILISILKFSWPAVLYHQVGQTRNSPHGRCVVSSVHS
jgi:hypothetical protein